MLIKKELVGWAGPLAVIVGLMIVPAQASGAQWNLGNMSNKACLYHRIDKNRICVDGTESDVPDNVDVTVFAEGGDDIVVVLGDTCGCDCSDPLAVGVKSAYIYGAGKSVTINGGDGNDVLVGGNGANFLNGNAGNDSLIGGPHADSIDGGAGDDRIWDEWGANGTMNGGADADCLFVFGAAATDCGGAGVDMCNNTYPPACPGCEVSAYPSNYYCGLQCPNVAW